jgi:hypothetical protein
MPFTLRPYRRLPAHCAVTYNAGPFQGKGIWNLSGTGWRLSGNLPMRSGETVSLTVTLPNEQRIVVLKRSCGGQEGEEFAVESVVIEPHTHARFLHL